MKKLFLLAMITAMVATTAVAQHTKAEGFKKNHAEWESKIKADLNLSADQSTKWDVVVNGFNDKYDALKKEEASLEKEAYKEKKIALKKEKEAKILEILTPEQQTKYKELVEKAKAEMKKPS
jgi:Spy/CpxP family protein refolding chaperone